MQKSLLKNLLGVVAVCSFSTTAFAVGLGGINVASALGQPLKADIELVAVNKSEKSSLVARLASPEAYKGAGLEYPYGNKFKFQVENNANGNPYLKVSSTQPTSDPFVSLLVELSWSSGKLLREYTFLLDPVGYVAEQPTPVEVQAVAPVASAVVPKPIETKPAVVAKTVEPQAVSRKPIEKTATVAPVKSASVETKMANVATGSITVKRGDTLNKIAAANKPADVSLERMLVALYSANADQFDGNNMNRIKTGKILRLPAESELMNVSQESARQEIHAQAADWNAYRQKLASAASVSAQPQESKQVSSGKISSSVADKAPVASDSAKEVLKLSKGEAPGDKTSAGGIGKGLSAQDKKNAAQEEAIAKAKAAKEEQDRVALLEKNLQDMQRLAELKEKSLAELKSQAATEAMSSVATVSNVAAVSAVTSASEVAPASEVKPTPVVKPATPPVTVETSLLDKLLSEPLYWGGAAAALLGLGGLGFALSRRKKAVVTPKVSPEAEVGVATGRITTPVEPLPETGDFTNTMKTHVDQISSVDEVDPISEADLFLNFGRDAQAEEILKEALQNTPNNHLIHLKLLGIYANRKDVNAFAAVARQLQALGNDQANQKAAAMGRKIDPNNPMYAGSASIEDADSATMRTASFNATDFELSAVPAKQVAVPDVDFDLGVPTQNVAEAVQQTATSSVADMDINQSGLMDFDVTATNPSLTAVPAMDFDVSVSSPAQSAINGDAEELPNLDDLIFDVTATKPNIPVTEVPSAYVTAKSEAADVGSIDFDLAFPVNKPSSPSTSMDFGGIDLNLDDVGEDAAAQASSESVKDEHWHEVATKLDLAKAYQEMGDNTGAKEILDEVVQEGDAEQRQAAQALLNQLA